MPAAFFTVAVRAFVPAAFFTVAVRFLATTAFFTVAVRALVPAAFFTVAVRFLATTAFFTVAVRLAAAGLAAALRLAGALRFTAFLATAPEAEREDDEPVRTIPPIEPAPEVPLDDVDELI